MTKKHFIKIASILHLRVGYNFSSIEFDNGYNKAIDDITRDLADYFEDENPLFNRAQFLTAAGL